MEVTPTTFGAWIRQRRRELDLTQAELAQHVACSIITLQKLEGGARRPSHQMLARLADCLRLDDDQRAAFLRLGRSQRRTPEHGARGAPPPNGGAIAGLPRVLTPLIGRERELALLIERVCQPETRLITCLGSAGVGKTRLALEVATELQGAFRDGVAFVPLAPISEPQFLTATVAQVLGLQLNSANPLHELASLLCDRQLLLVLDNFEQITAAAPLVTALLHACPTLTVIVTSRTRLRVRGERIFTVTPLALPDLATELQPALLAPSVALFCAIAKAADPALAMGAAELAAIAQICVRLDGLPLAIEIVATRAGALPPQLLLAQLDAYLLGAHGPRDLPDRQLTLRAAFDWSYALLSQAAQDCFMRLAVCAPGWTLAAAAAVCGQAQAPALAEAMVWLEELLDHSLIYRVATDGQPRFALLEPIREYALEQLELHAASLAAREQHAHYYLALAESAAPEMRSGRVHAWIDQLRREHDNLRSALAWLLLNGATDRAGRLCIALRRFWWAQGHLREGLGWMERLYPAHDQLAPELRADVLYSEGMLAAALGDLARAERCYQAGLALARATNARWVVGACANGLGVILAEQQHYAEAQALLEEGLEVDRQLGEQNDLAVSLSSLAGLYYHQSNLLRARELYEESLAIHRDLGDIHSVAMMLNNVSELALRLGDYSAARHAADQALQLARELNAERLLPYVLNNRGLLACRSGDLDHARRALAEAIRLLQQTGDRAEIVTSLLGFAELARALEIPEQFARLLGALHAAEAAGVLALSHTAQADLDALHTSALALLGAQQLEEHWRAGALLSFEAAIAEALTL